MSARFHTHPAANAVSMPATDFTPARGGLLQRKCACGGAAGLKDDCDDCSKKKLTVQRRAANQSEPSAIPDIVQQVLRSPGKPLDASTREFVQSRFGHDFSRVAVGAQSKLAVNEPGDRYEQEADRMAEQVTRATAPTAPELAGVNAPDVAKVHEQSPPAQVQRKAQSSSSQSAGAQSSAEGRSQNPSVESVGEASSPAVENSHGASRSGFDFGKVRVHTDERAAEAARALNARAFTLGHDIVFAAGEYAPETSGGRFLLAHELTHVLQQSDIPSSLVQRSITVQSPGAQTPNIPPPFATMTNAQLVQRLLDDLCTEGAWTVDGTTGVVAPASAEFCNDPPTPPFNHYSFSNHRASCGCLCELTRPGSRAIRVRATDSFAMSGMTFNVAAAGQGITVYPHQIAPHAAVTEHNVGTTGREGSAVSGVGATAPLSGTNPAQALRTPSWLVFGHELCGHARLQTAPTRTEHTQTPEGNLSAVDVENQMRREHSTAANNLGIRRGVFRDSGGGGHAGSFYQAVAGETMPSIATRCGLSAAQILTNFFRANGDPVTATTQGTLGSTERLLIQGIFWHEVMTGETAATIAATWGIPEASLRRANPALATAGSQPTARQRLLIPAT